MHRIRDVRPVTAPDPVENAGTDERGHSVLAQLLAQQAGVAELGQRALAEPDLEVLLAEACALAARILETELVSVAELEEDGRLRVIAGVGWRPGVIGEIVLQPHTGSQSGFTLETGGPIIVEDLRREKRFRVPAVVREHDAVSGMSVRIGDAGRPFGVLAVYTGRSGRFSRDDANVLQAIANILAAAVSRMRVESELRRSRDELAAIVRTATDGILVRDRQGRLLYANEAAARLERHASAAPLLAAPGEETAPGFELFGEDGQPLSADQLPDRLAIARGRPTAETIVCSSWRATGEERWYMVQASPVQGEDGSVEKVVVVLRDVTDQKREDSARHFLTEALATVSSILDQTGAARRLAQLSVPRLADFCAIDLLDVDGTIEPVALAHVDKQLEATAWRLARLHPVLPDDRTGPGRVVREGQPEFVDRAGEAPPSKRRAAGADEPFTTLGLTSWLRVPLLARGGPIGSLTLASGPSGRALGAHDLSLAEELGARAGIALENARLYESADDRRAELDAVLAAIGEAVLVFDARGRLRLTNRAAENLFSADPPRSVAQLARRVDPAASSPHDGPAAEGDDRESSQQMALTSLEGEVQLPGRDRWFELRRYRSRRTPADRGERHGPFVVVLRDVTDARAARAAREAFLGMLSHELRTPITTIYGGSELLERELDEDRRNEVVGDIRSEAERLARLVEDLLVMTRVERGGVEIGDEPVLVQRVVPRVVQALASRSPGLRIETLVADNLPAVRGDVTYIEQVLRNLLTNAVRYGEGLERGVTVAAEEQDSEVVVRVLDLGPGLGADDPERLFQLFYRSEAAQRVPGGAGIGLFVCRHLVDAMGGRIWAARRPEGGSEFGFGLPVIDSEVG
jgi:signal transduction histidine kinase